MTRIKLTVEYDGTAYAGWQRQENALAVQQCIEEALEKLTGEPIRIKGAGRTDSGVHALGQVAHFDTESRIPPEKYFLALNTLLPPDIRISRSEAVSEDFDARFGAVGKLYEYRIYNGTHLPPLMRNTHCFIPQLLDTAAMARAARHYVGVHDFAAFAASDKREGSTVREVYDCQVLRQGNEILIRVSGRSFLYNMVRILSGTLIEVGLGRADPDAIPEMILAKDRTLAGRTAPACGLTLVEVYY